jgi:hypothetical protein
LHALVVSDRPQDLIQGSNAKSSVVGPPTHLDCSPAPRYHCASKEARERFWAALREFVDAFRVAAEKLKLGDLTVAFPEGSFPPPRQFVPVPRARAPGAA